MSPPAVAPYAQIKAAFDALADLPPAARAAWLGRHPLAEPAAAQLHELLRHHDLLQAEDARVAAASAAASGHALPTSVRALRGAASDALAEPAGAPASASVPAGARFGPWAIVQRIGAGGMGDVYEARRADGRFEGRAAIKLLRAGAHSAGVLARFAGEQQALARLSHPHIARLLDAGVNAAGAPYFVMEMVVGRHIPQAAVGLSVRRRIELLLQLADAVAYAHRNLIVHRDIKPGNVLVDRDGCVKLLDFGIAKALDPLEFNSGLTHTGERPFTPQYASPEQLRGEPVSTAADQYSLGVLMYLLLTGQAPYARGAVSAAEVARAAQVEVPLAASNSVLPSAGGAATARQLRGDLDRVLAKALEKQVDDRYPSVDALAADLRAWLAGRPVQARQASAAYLLARFAQRNRWAVLALAAGALGIVAGLLATSLQGHWGATLSLVGMASGLGLALVQTQRANEARRHAERNALDLRRLSREVVMQYGDALAHQPGGAQPQVNMLRSTIACMEMLLRAETQPSSALRAECAALHARLAHLHADADFNARSDVHEFEHHARRALALFEDCAEGLDAPQRAGWAQVLADLGHMEQMRGSLDAAMQACDEAQAMLGAALERHPGERRLQWAMGDVLVRRAAVHYGWDRPHRNAPDAALAALAQARVRYEAALGGLPADDAAVLDAMGTALGGAALVHARLERWSEAIENSRGAVAARSSATGLAPTNVKLSGGLASECNLLAGLLLDTGEEAQALAPALQAWETLQGLARTDAASEEWPRLLRFVAFNLARAQLAAGQTREVVQTLAASLDWLESLHREGALAPRLRARLARSLIVRAAALHLLGQPWQPDAERALALMQPARDDPRADATQRREAWLVVGEANWRAATQWNQPQRAALRAEARRAYDAAEALRGPLTAVHASRAAWARAVVED